MALLTAEAITLKSLRWGEADRIVTFYSRQHGKFRGIARGARRMKSRIRGMLEPFSRVSVTVFDNGHDSLLRVSQADLLEHFSGIRQSLDRLGSAARLVNLVVGISADRDRDPRIFEILLEGLRAIERSADASLSALIFQILVLTSTGFRPQTQHCAACGKCEERMSGTFSPIAGGLVCIRCASVSRARCLPLSPGSVAFIQQAKRWDMQAVSRLRATGQVRTEIEQAIEAYIHVIMEKPLPASREWVAEVSPAYPS